MAVLRFSRPRQFADRFRRYRLLVNGVGVGDIAAGGAVEVDVPAGSHEVRARIDWCSSRRLVIDVADGGECRLEVGSSLRGWRQFLLARLYLTVWAADYLYVRVAEPGRGLAADS